jgi:hypothetical protein
MGLGFCLRHSGHRPRHPRSSSSGCLHKRNLSLEVDTSSSSRRVTRSLEEVIERRGKAEAIRCDNELNASSFFEAEHTSRFHRC